MKLKQYLIIDDKDSDVEYLRKQLDKFPLFQMAAVVSTIESAIEVLAVHSIDLIFSRCSPNESVGPDPTAVGGLFTTRYYHQRLSRICPESYEIGKTSDYLLKPFSEERLHIALTRALQYQINTNYVVEINAIFLKLGRKIQRFEYQSIDYVEAYGGYSKVYSNGQMYLVNERLSLLTKLLPARLFVRVHKSYLINIGMITSYDRNNLWLGKVKIPIGVSFRPRIESLLALFNNSDEDE